MAGCGCGGQPVLPKTIRREWLQELTAQTQLNSSEVKALYARFRRLAPGGYLLPEQFKQTMGVLGLSDDPFLAEHMFRVFDSSGDGRLSFHEFVAALAIMIRGTEDQKLQLSFDMAAGKCQAESLSLEDFKKLVHACRGLTSSLVATADDTSDKEMDRLFYEIVGDFGGESDAPVMTLEMYKAAVQHEEFLVALGIVHRGSSASSSRRRSTLGPAGVPSPPASRVHSRGQDKNDHVAVPFVQIADLRSRLDRVEELLQQKVHEASKSEKYEDTQIISSDQSPIRRPASPPVNLVSATVADAWQDLAKFIEEWDVIRGKGSATGLRGASEASLHTTVPGFEEGATVSREASRAVSRMTSRLSDGAEPLWRKQETIQASHRKGHKSVRWNRLPGPKKGLAVHFGHESWNMVLSMMVGIRMSVARCKHEMHRELQPVDFIMQEKFTITPRLMPYTDERKTTRFVDFAPMVFQEIRISFGIHEDEYLRSVGPEQMLGNMVLGNLSSLSELSSEGKSGAFFYYTADGKYMLKTVTPKEFALLMQILKGYYDHIKSNPDTLVVRFLGLHCLRVQKRVSRFRPSRQKNLYFVVMANMFNTPVEIHRRYDLKGSWVGRLTASDKRDPHVALKDVDFEKANEKIKLGEERRLKMLAQIRRDSEFLANNNIIDYSLLLGIHEKDGKETGTVPPSVDAALKAIKIEQTPGLLSEDRRTIYFMGIIDILTPYDEMKKLEHSFKALRHDWRGVSCCPPPFYASRFCNFLDKAFA